MKDTKRMTGREAQWLIGTRARGPIREAHCPHPSCRKAFHVRRQNALAAASKLRRMVREHYNRAHVETDVESST